MKANSSLILGLKDLSQPEGQGQLKHDLTEQGEGRRPGVGVTKPIFSVIPLISQLIFTIPKTMVTCCEHHRWEGSVGFPFWRPLARFRKPP